MKPVSWQYSNTDKHGDDQVTAFSLPGLVGVIICDGVSSSSCGHIAAAFTCYYIQEYIEKEFKTDLETRLYKEMAMAAIQYAGKQLSEFALKIAKLHAMSTSEDDNMQAAEVATDETAPVNTKDQEKALLTAEQQEKVIYVKEEEPVTADTPVWEEYQTICNAFKYLGSNSNKENIIKFLDARKPVSFECTLTLNLVYRPEDMDYWEILSVNYGDSEFHVITWDKAAGKITAFLPHYKLSQDVLRSYISSEGKIVTGNPVILTRNVSPGDIILLSTDGAYLHYTTKGGFPYELFKNKFIHFKTTCQTLSGLPEAWFKYLRKEQAINDDFSLVIIEFAENYEPVFLSDC